LGLNRRKSYDKKGGDPSRRKAKKKRDWASIGEKAEKKRVVDLR
jgi:hypothetical protein